MTISTQNRTAGPFQGNGLTYIYPFYFKVFQAADLRVVRRNTASDNETVLELNTDYTVRLNTAQDANPGGEITVAVPLPFGNTITITSALDYLQPTDLTNQGGFYPRVINAALDRLTILVQQLLGGLNRSLKIPISDGDLNTTLPGKTLRRGRVLAFDEVTGEPTLGPDISGYVGEAIISEEPPANPRQGWRWFNPTIPRTYIYYEDGTSGQWVEESSESTDGGIREDLSLLNSTVQIAGVPAQTLVSRIEALEQRASIGALQSYTPVVLGNLTSGTGTYTSQVGNFYTLGDLVFFSASVNYTAHTGSGTIQVSLPSQAAAFGGRVALSVDYNSFNVGAGRQCVAFVTSGSSAATIFGADPSGGAVSNVFDTAATITISGFYRRVL